MVLVVAVLVLAVLIAVAAAPLLVSLPAGGHRISSTRLSCALHVEEHSNTVIEYLRENHVCGCAALCL